MKQDLIPRGATCPPVTSINSQSQQRQEPVVNDDFDKNQPHRNNLKRKVRA